MNSYERIYDMIIETNFPGDESARMFTAAVTGGKSLIGPNLTIAAKKHAARLEKTKTNNSSILAKYLKSQKSTTSEADRLKAILDKNRK